MDDIDLNDLKHIVASFNYVAPKGARAAHYVYPPASGRPIERPPNDAKDMRVYDGRPLLDQLTLDGVGFVVRRHTSPISDYYNSTLVRERYYPAVAAFVKAETGASRVLAFDHNLRGTEKAQLGQHDVRDPVHFVHNDYTVRSGPKRVRELVGEREAEALLRHRFAVINVWRPTRGPVQDTPLAVCDAQSMAIADFVETDIQHFTEDDLEHPHHTGEIYSIRHNPRHRWFYVPDMQHEEVILLKCYDSVDDGRARFTAHSAFSNPNSPEDTLPRESIEVRTLVFYAPQN